MACPFCGDSRSSIVRSRGGIIEDKVGRRRECANCLKRFPTTERVDIELLEQELGVREATVGAAPPEPTWHNADGLFHRLWGQAKDRQYVKRDWAAFQFVLNGLRRVS